MAAVPAYADERSLDGSGNNVAHPAWGQVGQVYSRIAAPAYADGYSAPLAGPPARRLSNRIYNDSHQNLFSENGVTQWGFVWGQFMDHTFGLRDEADGDPAPIAFDAHDPLEQFRNDFGAIDFSRTRAAAGTGVPGVPREQVNTVSSYIDGWAVYGGTNARLEWLREGPVDGDMSNNGARLLLDPGGLLPRRSSRGDVAAAPEMTLQGHLTGLPGKAMVAGDVRANENVALTATQTLFAREHNRIVDALPANLTEEQKFQVARRVVGAEQQYITYQEFLPSLGLKLAPYRGYDPSVDATLGNEFASVGYRAHSMVHGEIEPSAPAGTYSAAELEAFEAEGIEVDEDAGTTELAIPLNLTFGNPDLLAAVGVGPVLTAVGGESEYRNDETIDNQLRSVLFQIPFTPGACLDGQTLPSCFNGVVDLGAIDAERGHDHGVPLYNALRQAYGLAPKPSFTAVTGESTDQFPAGVGIDDPSGLDFIALQDITGAEISLTAPRAQTSAVTGIRRSTLAARLRAVFGSVDSIDAFTGMLSEQHVPGTEFGELQYAMWKRQFESLRDGDRFFYLNDPVLTDIEQRYGIGARRTLAQIITANTGLRTRADVFKLPGAPARVEEAASVGGTVPATLALTLGAPTGFGTFTAGVAKDYSASVAAGVTSTAGDALLSVADPSAFATGHLVNGTHVLAEPLRVGADGAPAVLTGSTPLKTWSAPAANAVVAIAFDQQIGAGDPLRTGTYAKTLTFTLSTTTP